MAATAFAGCGKPNNKEGSVKSEEETTLIEASDVKFSSKGEYKTYITSKTVDLSDIKADNVTITYSVFDQAGYKKAVEKAKKDAEDKENKEIEEAYQEYLKNGDSVDNTEDNNEQTFDIENKGKPETVKEQTDDLEINVDRSDFIHENKAKVEKVSANKDKLELSFSDPKAAVNLTDNYYVTFKGKKVDNKQAGADVTVTFEEYTVTPEPKAVLSNDGDTRLTLKLNEGSFANKVTKEDIRLSGSFEKMKVENISASGKNLTMQLTGTPQKQEDMTTYTDGIVSISPYAIENAGKSINAFIPVEPENMFLDSSTIKTNGDKVTFAVNLTDMAEDIAKLKPEDFSFEKDVTVTEVKKESDAEVILTATIKGAKDNNFAAAILDGQTLKAADKYDILINTSEADFYPVFDYVEENGNNLKFTLKLYANNGSFSDDIKPEEITLGGDFAKGKVDSLEKETDTTAKLMITVPSNGQTAETLDMDGEVTVKAGTLVSAWGSPTSIDRTYNRNYSRESLGRAADNFSLLQNICNDVNRQTRIINGINSNYSYERIYNTNHDAYVMYMPLFLGTETEDDEITGVDSRVFNSLVYASLGNIGITGTSSTYYNAVKEQNNKNNNLEESVILAGLELDDRTHIEKEVSKQVQSSETDSTYAIHGFDLELLDLDRKMSEVAKYFEVFESVVGSEDANILGVDIPNFESASENTTKYAVELSKAMYDASTKGKKPNSTEEQKQYKDYTTKYLSMLDQFYTVCDSIQRLDLFTLLDTVYSKVDNFDTTSYKEKMEYRFNVQNKLLKAISFIRFYELRNYDFEKGSDGKYKETADNLYKFSRTPDMSKEEQMLEIEKKIWEGVKTYAFEKKDTSNWKNSVFAEVNSYAALSKNVVELDITDPIYLINGVRCRYNSNDGSLLGADGKYYNQWSMAGSVIPFPMDHYTGAAWRPEQLDRLGKVVDYYTYNYEHQQSGAYCYTLRTEVKRLGKDYSEESDPSVGNDYYRKNVNFATEDIKNFYSRMNNRNLAQEFMKAGVIITKSVADSVPERGYAAFGVAFNWYEKTSASDWMLFNRSYNTRSNVYFWDSKEYKEMKTSADDPNECGLDVKVWIENHNQFVLCPAIIYQTDDDSDSEYVWDSNSWSPSNGEEIGVV